MPTNKPRVMVTVPDDVYQQIENYRYENRFRSQSLAVCDLINKGIRALMGDDAIQPVSDTPELSAEDRRLLAAYHAAEPAARQFALEMLENHPAQAEERRA